MRSLFHMHKWSKWADPIQTYSGHKQQWRVCVHCNHASFRTLWWDRQTSLIAVIESLKGLAK